MDVNNFQLRQIGMTVMRRESDLGYVEIPCASLSLPVLGKREHGH